MQIIELYRGGVKVLDIKPDPGSVQTKAVMGENFISLNFELSFLFEFKIGDYCMVFGEVYKVLEPQPVNKTSRFAYEYNLKLLAEGAELSTILYLSLDNTNTLSEPDFSLMGDAQTFANLLLQNALRISPGWVLGEIIQTGFKNLTFSQDSCLSALSKVAEAFNTEWWIEGRTIHLAKRVRDSGVKFQHGQLKGLYEIQRNAASGSSVITRLYARGADKNLPPLYGSLRLQLPSTYDPCSISNLTIRRNVLPGGIEVEYIFDFTPATGSGIAALTIIPKAVGSTTPYNDFTGGNSSPRSVILPGGAYDFAFKIRGGQCDNVQSAFVAAPTTAVLFPYNRVPYIEQNIAVHGLIEGSAYFEDIYPQRTGKVTAVDALNVYEITDTSIDFDLNNYFLPGSTRKITFNTGQLAGYTFDISRYDATTKTVYFNKNKDERAIDVPSQSIHAAIGDEYVFVDIQLPQSYVTAAENRLLVEATKLLAQRSMPNYLYTIQIDPKFINAYQISIKLGDEVTLSDPDLQVNKKIRIINLNRDLLIEDKYEVQLGESVTQSTLSVINNSIQATSSGLNQLGQQVNNSAIQNGIVIGDLNIQQGTPILKDIPTTTTYTGFAEVLIELSSGKLYRKI